MADHQKLPHWHQNTKQDIEKQSVVRNQNRVPYGIKNWEMYGRRHCACHDVEECEMTVENTAVQDSDRHGYAKASAVWGFLTANCLLLQLMDPPSATTFPPTHVKRDI